MSEGTTEIAEKPPDTRHDARNIFPSALRRTSPANTLPKTPSLQNSETISFCWRSHQAYDTLLQEPLEIYST